MVKKKVRKSRRKKFEKPVDPMAALMTHEIDAEPFVKGAKAVGSVAAKGARSLAEVVFPSHESELRRKRKEIKNIEEEIELVKLQRKREKLLQELKEAGE